MVMIPIRAGWRDKMEKEPEWRGLLRCEGDCPRTTGVKDVFTYHLGFPAKRQATLYGLPLVPLGRSSVGYIACEKCRKGRWWEGESYRSLSRQASANLASSVPLGATQGAKVIGQATEGAPTTLQELSAMGAKQEWQGILECSHCTEEKGTQALSYFGGFSTGRKEAGDGVEGTDGGFIACLVCGRGGWLANRLFIEMMEIAEKNRKILDPDGIRAPVDGDDSAPRGDTTAIAKERIGRLDALRQEGILTEEEYQYKRAQVIDEIVEAN